MIVLPIWLYCLLIGVMGLLSLALIQESNQKLKIEVKLISLTNSHKSCTNCKYFKIWTPQYCGKQEPIFKEPLDCVKTAKLCKSYAQIQEDLKKQF
jgi:hypothetical protein